MHESVPHYKPKEDVEWQTSVSLPQDVYNWMKEQEEHWFNKECPPQDYCIFLEDNSFIYAQHAKICDHGDCREIVVMTEHFGTLFLERLGIKAIIEGGVFAPDFRVFFANECHDYDIMSHIAGRGDMYTTAGDGFDPDWDMDEDPVGPSNV